MKFEIPTSPAVAQKIENVFKDKILKPKNMELIRIETNDGTWTTLHIDWKHGELSDLFFLGYWSAQQNGDLKTFDESINNLSTLYEEGKDCLFNLSILDDEAHSRDRLFEVLKEIRDLAGVTIKNLYKP